MMRSHTMNKLTRCCKQTDTCPYIDDISDECNQEWGISIPMTIHLPKWQPYTREVMVRILVEAPSLSSPYQIDRGGWLRQFLSSSCCPHHYQRPASGTSTVCQHLPPISSSPPRFLSELQHSLVAHAYSSLCSRGMSESVPLGVLLHLGGTPGTFH